jgi:hypothetical protein
VEPMTLALILVVVVALAIARRAAGLILGAVAWTGLVLITLSVIVGVAVPGSVLAVTVAVWFASQVATRLSRGYWRSPVMRGLAGYLSAITSRPAARIAHPGGVVSRRSTPRRVPAATR